MCKESLVEKQCCTPSMTAAWLPEGPPCPSLRFVLPKDEAEFQDSLKPGGVQLLSLFVVLFRVGCVMCRPAWGVVAIFGCAHW